MTEFTRLTVSGTERRAELVVPGDEPIGGLLPRLMELLQEPTGPAARPLTLVRATGEQVDSGLSAAQQHLLDGEQLRLVRADEAPPPPEVADVTDVVSDSYANRFGRWSVAARQVTASVAIGVAAAAASLLWSAPATLVSVTVALLAAAVLLGRLLKANAERGRWPSIACTAAAAGLALGLVDHLMPTTALGRIGLIAVVVAALWVVLGLGFGAGLGNRPAAAAAVLGAVLALLPVVLTRLGILPERSLLLVAGAAVVCCGLLPWYALASSGLTGLDDQVVAGHPGGRTGVLRTVDTAYRSLSWAGFAVALPLAIAPAVLVGSANPWALASGVAVIVITVLRTRVFPLVVQRMPLWLAALTGVVMLVLGRRATLGTAGTAALLVALALVIAVLAGIDPAEHHRARLRRFGNLIEALAVIALPVLVLGAFGVYGDLLGAFR